MKNDIDLLHQITKSMKELSNSNGSGERILKLQKVSCNEKEILKHFTLKESLYTLNHRIFRCLKNMSGDILYNDNKVLFDIWSS